MSKPWTAAQSVTGTLIKNEFGFPVAFVYEEGPAIDLISASPVMLDALETVKRAIESKEFKEWEGKAFLTEIRSGDRKGYTGEQFMGKVNAAIELAKGVNKLV